MTSAEPELKRSLGLLDLVLFNIVAIVGLRWVSVAAGLGPSSIVLWVASMLFFFIPSALVVTELSSKLPGEGGIYLWTRRAFGDFHGFLCGFLYWVSIFIYYPNLLISVAGLFLYIFGSRFLNLENNSVYAGIFSLVVLWLVILLNIIGIKTVKWLQNLGALGTWLPALILLVLGIISWIKFGSANDFMHNLMPTFEFATLVTFSQLCFSFAGMELQSFMGGEIKDPRRTIPRAIVIAGVVIALIYILCTSAVLLAMPTNEVNIVTGVIQVISRVGEHVNVFWLGPIIALLMVLGGAGGFTAWFSGTARIPFVFGIDNYLPSWLAHVHPRWGTPVNAILVQGVVSTVFIILAAAGASLTETYTLLVDSTVIFSFIPYLYMFAAFIVLKFKKAESESGKESTLEDESEVAVTGKDESLKTRETKATTFDYPIFFGGIGFLATLVATILAFIPCKGSNVWIYEAKLVGGFLFFLFIAFVLFFRRKTTPQT